MTRRKGAGTRDVRSHDLTNCSLPAGRAINFPTSPIRREYPGGSRTRARWVSSLITTASALVVLSYWLGWPW